jgi:DNA-binding transcriptional ArsR family regulator
MSADHLSPTFGDPTRRAILSRLSQGATSVSELAKPFKMSLPGISKHLKVLERAGLIVRGRQAQWRPCRLDGAPLKDVAKWVDQYRRHRERIFDRLEDYLETIQKEEENHHRDA